MSDAATVVNAAAPTTDATYTIASAGNNSTGVDNDWVYLIEPRPSLLVGTTPVTAVRVGTTTATKVYVGTTQAWP